MGEGSGLTTVPFRYLQLILFFFFFPFFKRLDASVLLKISNSCTQVILPLQLPEQLGTTGMCHHAQRSSFVFRSTVSLLSEVPGASNSCSLLRLCLN